MTTFNLCGISSVEVVCTGFATKGGLLMYISGGDFDDALNVIDVWMDVDTPVKTPNTDEHLAIFAY
jgi:hypothetical protein